MTVPLLFALVVGVGTAADLPVRDAAHLRVVVAGDVRVIADPSATTVHVRATSPGTPRAFSVDASRDGKTMTVRIIGPGKSVLPFSGPSGGAYEVRFPARMALELNESAGNVRIDGARAPVSVFDDAGDITVAQAHDSVDVATDAGAVAVSLEPGWAGHAIRMQASAGRLRLTVPPAFRGAFDASTGQGRVTNPLRSVRGGVPVFLLVRSGDIDVSTQ